jgi:hypothetical protein
VIADCRTALIKVHNNPGLPHVYRMNDEPVILNSDERGVRIRRITRHEHMKEILSKCASFSKRRRGEGARDAPIDPPKDICAALIADPGALPMLHGVKNAPILRSDGTVHQVAGYDARTGCYFDPAGMAPITVPERPTTEDVTLAKKRLLEPFAKFCFSTPADLANYMALLVTLVTRQIIPGNTPLFVINSPVQGSGKSKLAYCANIIATGGREAPMTAPERGGDDEVRKRLTAHLMTRPLTAMLDNVVGKVNWPSLASILTTGKWADRLLQKSEIVTMDIHTVFFCTGVNVEIAGDMARRCVYIHLDPGVDKPWERSFDFDPETRVRECRAELLEAVFTLVRHWFVQGKPMWREIAFGSFEQWAGVVGGILAEASIEGFLGNRSAADDAANRELDELAAFFDGWTTVFGDTPQRSTDVVKQLSSDSFHVAVLRDSLPEEMLPVLDQHEGRASVRFGRILAKFRDRIAGGYKLTSRSDPSDKIQRWAVIPVALDPAAVPTPGVPGVARGLYSSEPPFDNRLNYKRLHYLPGVPGVVHESRV